MIYQCKKCGLSKSNGAMGSVLPQCRCDWDALPRRGWVGLTDDDLEDLLGFHCDINGEMNEVDAKKFAADIEKRLKEKNA